MDRKSQRDISRKLKFLNYAKETGNISKTCRYFGICRETFYTWKRTFEAHGENALINQVTDLFTISKKAPVYGAFFIDGTSRLSYFETTRPDLPGPLKQTFL